MISFPLWISLPESHTSGPTSSRSEVALLFYPLQHPQRAPKVPAYHWSAVNCRDSALVRWTVNCALKPHNLDLRLGQFCSVPLFPCPLESQNLSVSSLKDILKAKHTMFLNFHSVTTKGRIMWTRIKISHWCRSVKLLTSKIIWFWGMCNSFFFFPTLLAIPHLSSSFYGCY